MSKSPYLRDLTKGAP